MEEIIKKLKENKIYLFGLIFVLLIVLVSDCLIYYYLFYKDEETVNNDILTNEEEVKEEIEKYVVEIKGEVVTPGVYEVNSNKRVNDIIKLAGGLTKNASVKTNNLSKKVTDEMLIIIYSNEEIKNYLKTKEEEQLLSEKCISDCNNNNNSCIDVSETKTNSLISLNTSSLEELQTLPGIGESKANAIISYRKDKPFKNIEELKEVPGIGEALYAQVKNFITT